MLILELIVLLAPGMVALVFNHYDFFKKSCGLHFVTCYFTFELLTLMISYGIFMLGTGGSTVYFSGGVSDHIVPSFYSSRFVFKFSALLFLVAALLGTLERRYHPRLKAFFSVLWRLRDPGEAKESVKRNE